MLVEELPLENLVLFLHGMELLESRVVRMVVSSWKISYMHTYIHTYVHIYVYITHIHSDIHTHWHIGIHTVIHTRADEAWSLHTCD
jgi:hypothetical protein